MRVRRSFNGTESGTEFLRRFFYFFLRLRTSDVLALESRVIPMNATTHSLLSELVKNTGSPLVFPTNRKKGEKLLDLKKGFKKAVGLAGIPHIRFHDMRHTFAIRLVQAGVEIVSVQHLLGHSKITMTVRYAHSLADVKMAAVCKVDLAGP
jgi:integrase